MKKIDIESMERNNPYRVPDGYFSELRNTLTEKVEQQQAESSMSTWQRLRSLASFAAMFGVLVMVATVGYYFTGYKATLNEAEQNDPLLGYRITMDDIEALEYEFDDQQQSLQFAAAANEYLETYGFGYLDTEVYETLNGK